MIYITLELEQQIRREGEKYYPDECCGILFGELSEQDSGSQTVKRVKSLLPVVNSFSDGERYHRFLITPETMLQAELEARRRGQDIVGFYHSHPDHPAIPSEYDRAHALPVYSYVITAVAANVAVELNSFELSSDKHIFYPEEIHII